MSRQRQHNYLALVLKSRPQGERDALVTIVTQQVGRVVAAAPGIRQLRTPKRAYLQAGNLVHVQLVETKSLPLPTHAQLVSAADPARATLAQLKRLLLFLEILDRLLTSEQLPPDQFQRLLYLRELFLHNLSNRLIKQHFISFLTDLGYFDAAHADDSITVQVNTILDSQLHSFEYFALPTTF